MIISNITPPQVWSASSRSLTNIGSGALAPASSQNQTLAAATAIQLTTSAGIVGQVTVGISTGVAATGTVQISLNDGTQNFIMATSAAGAQQTTTASLTNTNAVGLRLLNNDAAVAAKWATAQFLWTI